MPKEKIIVAVDIGSSKVCAIVASVVSGRISVIGSSTVPSKGIDRGVVNDIDKAVEVISEVIEKCEKMSGHAISKAIVTINGQHIQCENSTGVVAVTDPQGEITKQDITRVNEAAQAVTIPSNREVIHVIPRGFIVDSQGNVKNPEGMSGIRLEVEAHIIHASTTVIKNLVKCVKQVGVEVSELIYTAYASSQSVLTDTEKELGCVLIDIGGRTSSCIVYQNESPIYSFVIPVGGKHITGDIAVGLRCSLDVAEKVKMRISKNDDEDLPPDVVGIKNEDIKKGDIYLGDIDADLGFVPRKFLESLVNDRISEIMSLIYADLKKAGYDEKISAGAVITGGACETLNLIPISKHILKIPVRISKPKGLTGLIDEIEGPAYSACVGALMYQSQENSDESFSKSKISVGAVSGLISKIKSLLKNLIP